MAAMTIWKSNMFAWEACSQRVASGPIFAGVFHPPDSSQLTYRRMFLSFASVGLFFNLRPTCLPSQVLLPRVPSPPKYSEHIEPVDGFLPLVVYSFVCATFE